MQRQSRGEPPLPEEDLSKLFKPHQAPARMDSLLIAGITDRGGTCAFLSSSEIST